MNFILSMILALTAVLGLYTGIPPAVSGVLQGPRRASPPSLTVDSDGEEIVTENETPTMVGWTESEKLFMQQTNYAKHEAVDSNGNRIVGGKFTIISRFPYQLQLNIDRMASCGAAIISVDWAITAAHCLSNKGRLYPTSLLSLRAGATIRNMGGKVHQVAERIVHPLYESSNNVNKDNDIGLLKVKTRFKISFLVQPIRLPFENLTISEGNMAVVSGWGTTRQLGEESNILQQVAVPIVQQSSCAKSYSALNTITIRMLCAGREGIDSCQGDSGGPLAYDNKLVGIVSFGHGCGLANFPGVYAKVSEFRGFIREKTGL